MSASYRFLDMTLTPALQASVSGTNTYATNPISGQLGIKAVDFETFTFQATWTGTISGTISVLGSLDGVNFYPFGVGVAVQPAGSPGGVVIPLFGHGMKFLQLSYTNASGSGSLTVSALGKTR